VSITIYVRENVKICVSGCEWVCTRVCACALESGSVSIQICVSEYVNNCVGGCECVCTRVQMRLGEHL